MRTLVVRQTGTEVIKLGRMCIKQPTRQLLNIDYWMWSMNWKVRRQRWKVRRQMENKKADGKEKGRSEK